MKSYLTFGFRPKHTGLLVLLALLTVVFNAEIGVAVDTTSAAPLQAPGKTAAWVPPIGIPAPDFGIDETHWIYQGQTYDYNGTPGPYSDAGNGPYSHYVDTAHPQATDTDNPYGTYSLPRLTFPDAANIQAGAVIEIHASQQQPYTSDIQITSSGSALQPIFVRGASATVRPVVQGQLRVRGHYVIVENIDFDRNQGNGGAVRISPASLSEEVHHVAIRGCEVRNLYKLDAGNSSMMYASGMAGNVVHDVVYYNNHIHPGDDVIDPPQSYEKDTMGIYLASYSENGWIVDNHIHNLAGDCVGGGHAANYTARNYYIGRNTLHDAAENAIDLKEVENIVISQNVMYSFYGASAGSGGGGTAAIIHHGPTYSPKNVWFLFNEIHTTNQSGLRMGGGQEYDAYVIGNIIHNIHNDSGTATGYRTWDSQQTYFINNLFYDVDNGVDHDMGNQDGRLIFHNNMIANVDPAGFHLLVADSVQRDRADIQHNLFYQPGGEANIDWGSQNYNVAEFQAATGKCQGCLEADPEFSDPLLNDFRLQYTSPAINAGTGHALYQLFQDLFGPDIRVDYAGTSRPQGAAWDIGPYEFLPGLSLQGIPDDGSIHLNWQVNATLPSTTTWTIQYQGPPGDEPSPIEGIPSETRTYTLTGLTNYEWYTVTLSTDPALLTDTLQVMPTNILQYLPLILQE
jgi:hypothetical protein